MKFSLYAVRDSLIGFGMPVIRDNDAVASRAFEFDITREGSPYSSHPEHFQLYKIGVFDTDNASIEPESPTIIASAVDFIGKE